MKVGIIFCAFNCAETIEKCLDSWKKVKNENCDIGQFCKDIYKIYMQGVSNKYKLDVPFTFCFLSKLK